MYIFKKIICFILLTILVTTVCINTGVNAIEDTNSSSFEGYIIKMLDTSISTLSMSVDGSIKYIGDGHYIADSLKSINKHMDVKQILYIEPNYRITLFDYPDDPYYNEQWSLNMIDISAAWTGDFYGDGVKVAIIDSGLVNQHEDINYENVKEGFNFTNVGTIKDTTDQTGHGSLVTGIIGAQINNKTGIAGMTDSVYIVPLKCFSSKTTTLDMVLSAIYKAIDEECDVINMSFGMTSYSQALEEAVNEAASKGIIMVSAVGNAGTSALYYPAAFNNVIGVGSVNYEGTVSGFSQKNSSVFVTAPGENLISIGYTGISSYGRLNSGTSFSAPFVTSLAAMAKQCNIEADIDDFKQLLSFSSVDKGTEGYDTSYGHGIINVSNFITYLNKEYTITYELYDDTLTIDENAPNFYTFASNEISLPNPPLKVDYSFGGWYNNPEYTGDPITCIPTASIGNKKFYAKWIDADLLNTNITDVSVGLYKAVKNPVNYTVFIPAGTEPVIDSKEVTVTTENPDATYTAETFDKGYTWIVTVTSANGDATCEYIINVDNETYYAPAPLDDLQLSKGTATPASIDGITPAVPYIVDNLSEWFWNPNEEDTLMFYKENCTGKGDVNIKANKLIYIPSREDSGNEVSITVKAYNARFDSSSGITVYVDVDQLPVSTSVINPVSSTFDKYEFSENHNDIIIGIYLYGNHLIGIKNEENLLSDEDYILNNNPVGSQDLGIPENITILKKEYLIGLDTGDYSFKFLFDSGNPPYADLNITIFDSTPFIAVTDIIDVPTVTEVGSLTLTGMVTPENATYKDIKWIIKDAGTTAGSITDNTLTTVNAGTLIVTAEIENGTQEGVFSKDFTITVNPLNNNQPDPGNGNNGSDNPQDNNPGSGGYNPPSSPGGGSFVSFIPLSNLQYIYLIYGDKSVSLSYSLSINGATLHINENIINQICANTESGEVIIDASEIQNLGSLSFMPNVFNQLASACIINNKTLHIKMGSVIIKADIQALRSLSKIAADNNVTISARKVNIDTIPSNTKISSEGAPIYDLSFKTGFSYAKTVNGNFTVSLPFELNENKNITGVVIRQIDQSGNVTTSQSIYNPINKYVTFNANFFSHYVIDYDETLVWKNPFKDIPDNSNHLQAVQFVNYNKLFFGTSATEFSPDLVMNRAMFVTVLGRMAGITVDHAAKSSFTDVIHDGWSTGYIEWASENKIVSGYGNGKFGQYDIITREQMAVILYNYANYAGYDTSDIDKTKLNTLQDANKTGQWAVTAVAWAVNNGLIICNEGDSYSPQKHVTRLEVATTLHRFSENIKK